MNDNDEPLTEEWIAEVGGDYKPNDIENRPLESHSRWLGPMWFGYFGDDQYYGIIDCNGGFEVKTRGQVRELSRILGFPLKNSDPYHSPLAAACRELDFAWRKEIEKYLPQLAVMSFCGPIRTIAWLMERVTIKDEHRQLADKLNEIRDSDLSEAEKGRAEIETMFPKLARDASSVVQKEEKG